MPFNDKGQPFSETFFGKGVVISFDLVIDNLKRYYSEKSPQGAYAVIAKEFESKGFEKLRDSDYRHRTMSEADALELISEFSKREKWFPVSISKVIVSPNVPKLDVSDTIIEFFADTEWKNKKDKEYEKSVE